MNLVYSEAGELDNIVGMPSKKGDLGKLAYLVDKLPDLFSDYLGTVKGRYYDTESLDSTPVRSPDSNSQW
jgi:hypothetical protein